MATPLNRSVFKAFAMLKSFRRPDEWVTSSELSRRANLPEASGYRLVQTLEEIGAVVRGPRGKYRPGMLLVSLSKNVIVSELLQDACQQTAAELSDKLKVTIHVGILEGGMVTYLTKQMTPGSFVSHTRAGSQLEPYCSGLGKVLLADLSPEQLEDTILDAELVALTPYTITTHAVLRAQLDEVRRRGFAIDDRESSIDTCCVAVPIKDGYGRAVAAISATERAEKMTPQRQAELCLGLQEAAAALSCKVFPPAPPMKTLSVPPCALPSAPPSPIGRMESQIGAC